MPWIPEVEHCKDGEHYNLISLKLKDKDGFTYYTFHFGKEAAEKMFEELDEALCEYDKEGRAIVLDPFAGSGTTCAVAKKLGRAYVGIEQNSDYCILAEKRTAETEEPAAHTRAVQLELF